MLRYFHNRGYSNVGTMLKICQKFSTTNKQHKVTGRASSAMTQAFVSSSKLHFYHKFERSQLYINPIIHGAPAFNNIEDHDYIELLTKRAVLKNRSNCLVVYQHLPQKSYYFKGMRSLFNIDPQLSRQHLVAMANIGKPTITAEVFRRLTEACELSQLEYIDFAYFEVSKKIHLVIFILYYIFIFYWW